MNDFTLGAHSARLDSIEARLTSIDGKLDTLVAAENQRKGSWRTAAAAGGFMGAVLAFAADLVKGYLS
jgi:hypothetical protein